MYQVIRTCLEGYAYNVYLLTDATKKRQMFDFDQYKESLAEFYYRADFESVLPSNDLGNVLGHISDYTAREVVSYDRYAANVAQSVIESDHLAVALRGNARLANLPNGIMTQVSEYLLFDPKVFWGQESVALDHVVQTVKHAEEHAESEQGLLQYFVQVSAENTPTDNRQWLMDAIQRGHFMLAQAILKQPVDLQWAPGTTDSPLHQAIEQDNVDLTKRIMLAIQQQAKAEGIKKPQGLPVKYALSQSSHAVLAYFVSVSGAKNLSPKLLNMAVVQNDFVAVDILLKAGMSPALVDMQSVDRAHTDANIVALLTGEISPGQQAAQVPQSGAMDSQAAYNAQFKKHAPSINQAQLWQKRCYYALFATAVVSFAMAVVYPANIFLTMFYISAYSAVFFHVVTTNVVMRNPSIDNLRIDANLYGQQETSNVQQGVGNISFLSYKQVESVMPKHVRDPLSAVSLKQDMPEALHAQDASSHASIMPSTPVLVR